jgi:hypothetical protein
MLCDTGGPPNELHKHRMLQIAGFFEGLEMVEPV